MAIEKLKETDENNMQKIEIEFKTTIEILKNKDEYEKDLAIARIQISRLQSEKELSIANKINLIDENRSIQLKYHGVVMQLNEIKSKNDQIERRCNALTDKIRYLEGQLKSAKTYPILSMGTTSKVNFSKNIQPTIQNSTISAKDLIVAYRKSPLPVVIDSNNSTNTVLAVDGSKKRKLFTKSIPTEFL